MAEFYHGPWFAFYHAEFLSGTRHLQPDEGWSYFMLLIRAWEKGGIPPDDMKELASISGVTPARMKKIWPRIADKFIPSPNVDGWLSNAKLEEVREKAARFASAQSRKALKRAAGALPGHSPGTAGDKPGQSRGTATKAIAIVNSDSGDSNNLYTSSRAHDRTRTEESSTPVGGDAGAFAEWFLARGVESGAIPAHHKLDPGVFVYRNLEAAEKAVATYGADECRARAERFFTAKAARKIRRGATIAGLLECWDFDEIKGAVPVPSSRPARQARATDRGDAMYEKIDEIQRKRGNQP